MRRAIRDATARLGKAAAERVARRSASSASTAATLDAGARRTRTLYLFDVRDPAEYAAGHVAGAVSAPGGQLVQATDQYVGTLGARIVLVDDDEVRAVMTASWLKQMGWKDVFVLVAKRGRDRSAGAPVLGARRPPTSESIWPRFRALWRNAATVIDLSLSPDYRKAHIPGAWFAIRSRLAARRWRKFPCPATWCSRRRTASSQASRPEAAL